MRLWLIDSVFGRSSGSSKTSRFAFTHPAEYHQIAAELDESREERLEFMALAVKKIQALMVSHGIQAEVSGRPKHILFHLEKMQRKHLRFDQLFDVRAVRIIVETVEQCYGSALDCAGALHGFVEGV